MIGTIGVSTSAFAGQASSNMAVSTNVSAVCTISAGALAFGGYVPTSNAVQNGSATMSVTCTDGAIATIDLDEGANANTGSSATLPLRRLKFHDTTDHFVNYYLYRDSSRTQTWGTGSGVQASYTGTGVTTTVTAYAQIPGNQGTGTPAGTYQDTINATVNF